MAGCGQGKDADEINDQERARLRRQALDWLRVELAAWHKALQEQPDKNRSAVWVKVITCQTERDLNGVRDAQALAKLPPAEQEAWRSLWTEVAQLAKGQK